MAWRKIQVKKSTRLGTDNFRLQAVILEYENCKLLLFNTYFPCDSKRLTLTDDESAELHSLLTSISTMKQKYSGKFDTAIVLGDINYDDDRFTGHTQAVNSFLENERLCSVWDIFPVEFTFAIGETRSTIDHFLISNTQSGIILEAGAIHDPENLSGHSPIYVKVDLNKANNPPEDIHRNPRLNWNRSTQLQKDQYTQQLQDMLSQPGNPPQCFQCTSVQCNQDWHLHDIDRATGSLLGAMTECAWENLECTKGTTGDQSSRQHTIPGWNNLVKPFQGEAKFWYNLWLSAGKPLVSAVPGVQHDLFTAMKTSRNQYHYAVRRAQKSLNKIENDKLVSKMGTSEVYEEIKKSCKDKNSDLTSVVDDIHGAVNISNYFKNIYEQLYNEQNDISRELVDDINKDVAENVKEAEDLINLLDTKVVKAAVNKLKADKSDVTGQFTSDCLKAAPTIFFDQLSALFRTFLYHGHITQDLLVCALSPIVKDQNGDISSSKNYRGIAISSLILKVFDNCVLLLLGHLLSNDVLQFGFQKGCSTVQCTWAVQETISHYLRRGSEVFCCLLDFSKAFDKVNFDELFKKLRSRKFPPVVLRLIIFIYLNQSCFIRWNSVESDSFSVKNGVRQGAILSPSLFCVYLDTLLCCLRDAGVGCHVGGSFLGALGYADDVTLLSPTRQGLQVMLKICEDFSASHSMLFSTDPNPALSKTKCMFFSTSRSSDQVKQVLLNGDLLPWVDKAKHLGNHLSTKINLSLRSPETKTDLLSKRAILFDKVHQIQQQFGYYDPKLVINLLSIYSTALYGSTLWQLSCDEHQKLNRSWNTAVKMIWDLPHPTHTRFLESLSPVPHLESVLHGRYIGFLENLAKSKKPLITMLFGSSSSNLRSVTGENLQFLLSKYSKSCLPALVRDKHTIKKARVSTLPAEESWKIRIIEEISLVKKSHLELTFDEENLDEILEYICTF